MKKHVFKGVLAIIAVCIILATLSVVAFANTNESEVEIVSNNVYYGETLRLMYAVKAPEGETIDFKVFDYDGDQVGVEPFYDSNGNNYIIKNGAKCYTFITKSGVAAQNIAREVVATATISGGRSDTQVYSVLEYLFERLYVSTGVTDDERRMYNSLLVYANDADIVLNGTAEADTVSNYRYVRMKDCVSANSTGNVYRSGTVLAGFESSVNVSDPRIIVYTVKDYVTGEELVLTQEQINNGYEINSHVLISASPIDVAKINNIIASTDGAVTIYVDESLSISDGEYITVNNPDVDVTINFCGSTISANLIKESLFDVTAGKLTLTDGTIRASSSDVADGNGELIWASGNSKVEIKDMTISFDSTTVSNNIAVGAGSGAEMSITDTIIIGANGTNAFQNYGAHIILNSGTITQTGDALSSWYSSAIQLINVIKKLETPVEINGKKYSWQIVDASNLTVNGGTYIGKKAIQISAPGGGDLLITGGTFTGSDYVLQNDFAPQNYYIAEGETYTSNVTIEGGTFNGNIKLTAAAAEGFVIKGGTFNGDTIKIGSAAAVALNWENLQQFVADGATVTINGTSYIKGAIYNVYWMNGSTVLETDIVEHGIVPTYNGATPTKASTVQYTYTFSGWSPSISAATGDITYTAEFTAALRRYTVTWKNGNTLLKTDSVAYGATPIYNGSTPTKASTAQYTYTFSGWSPSISEVTGNITYTAQFSATPVNYTVIWMNGGSVLEVDSVPYGTVPEYNGATPTKNVDGTEYTFIGWTPEVTSVAGDVIYHAAFYNREGTISEDIALARELNEVLAEEDAIDDASNADFEAVLKTLRKRGYYIADLNAKTPECYFVWDQGSKQILLVDGRENYKVLYSYRAYDANKTSENWYFAIIDPVLAETVKTDLNLDAEHVKHTVANVTDFNNTIAAAEGDVTVYVDESLKNEENKVVVIDNANADITAILDYGMNVPFKVENGTLNIVGGSIGATGSWLDADGDPVDSAALAIGGTLNLSNTTVDAAGKDIVVAYSGSTGKISNTTINARSSGINLAGGSDVIVENCIVNVSAAEALFVSNNGGVSEATINGGEYSAVGNTIVTHGGHIVIENGTFSSAQYNLFKLYSNGGTITIKNGIFTTSEYINYSFDMLTEDIIKDMIATSSTNYDSITVTKNADGSYTIAN